MQSIPGYNGDPTSVLGIKKASTYVYLTATIGGATYNKVGMQGSALMTRTDFLARCITQ